MCAATAGFIYDYVNPNTTDTLDRAEQILKLVKSGGDISIGPGFLAERMDPGDKQEANGRSGSLTVAHDMKTGEMYASGLFYAIGTRKVVEFGGRSLLMSSDKFDLKETLERAHKEYSEERRRPVSLKDNRMIEWKPISRNRKSSQAETIVPPKPTLVHRRDGLK